MIRAALPMLATAMLPSVSLAHATTYHCDTNRDVCTPSGTCVRANFSMTFVVDDVTGSAAMVQDGRFTTLIPTSSAHDGLTFTHLGQRIRFYPDVFGTVEVEMDVAINDEATVAEFICAEEFS